MFFFSPLTKRGHLNPFDLHKRQLNGQICQADGNRRLAVAIFLCFFFFLIFPRTRGHRRSTPCGGARTSQKVPVFTELGQASVLRATVPLLSSFEPISIPAPHSFDLGGGLEEWLWWLCVAGGWVDGRDKGKGLCLPSNV